VDISILLCFLFWDVVYVTRQDDQYHGQIGSDKTSEIRTIRGILQTRWTRPHVQDSYRRYEEDYPRSRVRLGKDGRTTSNLTPSQVKSQVECSSSRNEIQDENVILPTIDLTFNPFNTPTNTYPSYPDHLNKEAGEQRTRLRHRMSRTRNRETNGRPTMSVPCPTSR
jgi:hypothetical protein